MTVPTLADVTRLSPLQRRVLAALAAAPDGLTTSAMEALCTRPTRQARMTGLGTALRSLERRWLVVRTGQEPRGASKRGPLLTVWTATEAGRSRGEWEARQ